MKSAWRRPAETRELKFLQLLDSCEVEERDAKKAKTRRKPFPATYEPDKRTAAWLKLKKDYITGLGDSFDLVPVGAWHGNGRKAKWWSPILLALKSDDGELVAVCKCMSGTLPICTLRLFRTHEVDWPKMRAGFTDAFYKVWPLSLFFGPLIANALLGIE